MSETRHVFPDGRVAVVLDGPLPSGNGRKQWVRFTNAEGIPLHDGWQGVEHITAQPVLRKCDGSR